jgi:hypothetical protein
MGFKQLKVGRNTEQRERVAGFSQTTAERRAPNPHGDDRMRPWRQAGIGMVSA